MPFSKSLFPVLLAMLALAACDLQPPLYGSKQVPPPDAPVLISQNILTRLSSQIPIDWQAPADVSTSLYYLFVVSDGNGQIVFQTQVPATGIAAGSQNQTLLGGPIADGNYTLSLSTVSTFALHSTTVSTSLQIDSTPPIVLLYLGANPVSDPCNNPPPTAASVATKLVPFDICLLDQGNGASGVTAVCILPNGSDDTPPPNTDPCWVPLNQIVRLLLLTNGVNTVRAFARDLAGNIAMAKGQITLDIGDPPAIDLLLPVFDPKNVVWTAGESHLIRWKVTSSFSPFDKIKIIITLVNTLKPTQFAYLACNFSNSAIWKQCPDPSIQSSALISTGPLPNTGQFNFVVPSWWDPTQLYMILITAIDEAGNAAMTSTQPLNQGAEVLAGRSYRGMGSSGATILRFPYTSGYIATDRRGQLYDLKNNFKINAFDYRTCRMLSQSPTDVTASDCSDILQSQYGLPNSTPWVYNSDKDVFYTAYSGQIFELNFTAGTITPIFGSPGTALLSPSIPTGALASAYHGSPLFKYLFYDTSSKKLFLRASGGIYTIDTQTNQIQYVLGAGVATVPPNQTAVAQSALILPDMDEPYAVTRDQRLVFFGNKLPSTVFGGAYGLHYIVDDFSLSNPAYLSNFAMLSPNGGALDTKDVRSFYAVSVAYDPINNRVFASFGTNNALCELDMPPKGSPVASYSWQPLIQSASTLENQVLSFQYTAASYPMRFTYYGSTLSYPGANVLYLVNGYTGSILSLELGTRTLNRIVGYPTGSEPDELGINRRLQYPRRLFLDNQNRVVFNDTFNLNRITLDPTGAQPSQISTAFAGFQNYSFKFDSKNQRIVQALYSSVFVYPYGDTISPYTEATAPSPPTPLSPSINWSYLHSAISNNLEHPQAASVRDSYDPTVGQISQVYLWANDFSDMSTWPNKSAFQIGTGTLLTATDRYALGSSYCGATTCGPNQLQPGSNYYIGSQYRLAVGAGGSTVAESNMEYDATDTKIYACINNGQFTEIQTTTDQIYTFTATLNGAPITCMDYNSYFYFDGTNLYWSQGNGVYLVDTSLIETQNTATLTLVATLYPMVATTYGGYIVTSDYIYYTDKLNGLVLRNRRAAH